MGKVKISPKAIALKWLAFIKLSSKKIYKIRAYLFIIIGISGIGLSIYLYLQQPSPPPINKLNAKSVAVTQAPSSAKPSASVVNSYSVPPDQPKYISIPAIGVDNAMIVRLGLLKTGAIATPDNIYETGWYQNSAVPGQQGAMFIYGHVSSWTADGVFYNLKRLRPGDQITIVRGDNIRFIYKVVALKIYPYKNVNMKQVLAPYNSKVPGLNLMTCTGKVIPGTSEFNERLAVFTELVSA